MATDRLGGRPDDSGSINNRNTRGIGRAGENVMNTLGFQGDVSRGFGNTFESLADPGGLFRGPGNIDFTANQYPVDIQGLSQVPGLERRQDWAHNMRGTAGYMRGEAQRRAGGLNASTVGQNLADFTNANNLMGGAYNAGVQQYGQAGRMAALADQFGLQAAGQAGPSPAELQLRNQAAQNIAAQHALAASATGGNAGAAMYNAAQQAADIGAQTNVQAMQQRAAEIQQARMNQLGAQQAAAGAYGAAGGLGQGLASTAAGMSQFNAGQAMQADMANAQAQQQMAQFRENQMSQADRDYWQNMMGLFGAELGGQQLGAQQGLDATRLGMESFYRPQQIEADIAKSEYETKAKEHQGVLGGIGGLLGRLI